MALAMVTTIPTTQFTPDPSCLATSTLWLTSKLCFEVSSPPASQPTNDLNSYFECSMTMLGEPPRYDSGLYVTEDLPCYPYELYRYPDTVAPTAYKSCPVSMTPAGTASRTEDGGLYGEVSIYQIYCCPSAFDFVRPTDDAHPSPTVLDGETYYVNPETSGYCKATSVEALYSKAITLRQAGDSVGHIGSVTWDSRSGDIFAEAATLTIVEYPSQTSTCWGGWCPTSIQEVQKNTTFPAQITATPTGPYVPPPTPPLTRFNPPSSCAADESNMWLRTMACSILAPDRTPDWLECAITQVDNLSAQGCNMGSAPRTYGSDGTMTWFSACAEGYSIASTHTSKPFDTTYYDGHNPLPITSATWNAVATTLYCCPSGDYDFSYLSSQSTSSTTHDKASYTLLFSSFPECVATKVSNLVGKQLTLTESWSFSSAANAVGTANPWPVTTAEWDMRNTLYAHVLPVTYTVFHQTHTCYEDCDGYFTSSYYNTDPNAPTGTGAGAASTATTTSGGSSARWGGKSGGAVLWTVFAGVVLGQGMLR
ncbi:hypothetical protein B0T22DRAFT_274973 [Podospora appendiculata]|uniref:Uncharacterized protein n=1 Tax=Podospora appendiculata TaxID=314037 RepID=A0AAE1C7T0_9PEZI|nr:hypothetical protein B0T22DRAFT_274973 [Podospora appendiculata]